MLNTIFEKASKFALLAVKQAYVELPEDEIFKQQLTDGTWVLAKIPVEIDTGWRELIGSLRHDSLISSNLILVYSEASSNPEILDRQHFEIEDRVSHLFHILQLSGITEYDEANLVVGSFYNGKSDVRRMFKLPKFFITRGDTPRPINIDRMEAAVKLYTGFKHIESDVNAFARLKRGLRVLMEGLNKFNGEDRIHEFVRSLEALTLPDIGKTRRQFVHRCLTFAKASTKSKQILEESFDLRSMTTHLNSWEKALESYSSDLREKTALLRTRQMERLACFSYSRLLENQSFRNRFISENEMANFWRLPDDQRNQIWSDQIDLEKTI